MTIEDAQKTLNTINSEYTHIHAKIEKSKKKKEGFVIDLCCKKINLRYSTSNIKDVIPILNTWNNIYTDL